MFQSRGRIGTAKILTFGLGGFAAGIVLGYIFMGTVHAVEAPLLSSMWCPMCMHLAGLTEGLERWVQVLQLREEARYSKGSNDGKPCLWMIAGGARSASRSASGLSHAWRRAGPRAGQCRA